MAKLNHNSTLLVICAFFLISSCGFFIEKLPQTHAEILCPELGHKILIRNIKSSDFLEALDNFHKAKVARGTDESYTILIFRNKYSMQLSGIKSEELRDKCFTRDVSWENVDKDYLIY